MLGIGGNYEPRPLRWLDDLVQNRLRQWPDRPPGLAESPNGDFWLRGRPGPADASYQPFLKLPGSDRLRTLPDGLWLNFGGRPEEAFVDIFAIEACGNIQNLLDKRSRFAPSTHSMLAVCPLPWLLGAVGRDNPMPRWRATGVMVRAPVAALVAPVRDLRVMYGLKAAHYTSFAASQIPHAHEYFVPMDALTAEASRTNPALCALVARAASTASGNFLYRPACGAIRTNPAPPPPRQAGPRRRKPDLLAREPTGLMGPLIAREHAPGDGVSAYPAARDGGADGA